MPGAYEEEQMREYLKLADEDLFRKSIEFDEEVQFLDLRRNESNDGPNGG